jgi:hypothetical protein
LATKGGVFEIGRFWQILWLPVWYSGFGFYAALSNPPANPELRLFVRFLIAVFAIPFFIYQPSEARPLLGRRCMILADPSLVEGFFEFFGDCCSDFVPARLVARMTAIRVIYLDAILYLEVSSVGPSLVFHRPE